MTITFYLSAEFQKSEFARTAKNQPISFTADVDLTPEQAKRLLEIFPTDVDVNKGQLKVNYFMPFTYVKVHTLDPQSALNELFNLYDFVIAAKKEETRKMEENLNKEIELNRQNILGNKEYALQYYDKYGLKNVDEKTKEFILKSHEEEKQEREQKKIAAEKVKEEAKEKLKLWALSFGTELLQLRIEENMNWYDLANTEYFKSILPEGFKEMAAPDISWEIKNATIEQIKALREVKKDHPEAKLMRYKYNLEPSNGEYFEEDEEETEHKDVIQITLKSISGEEKTFEKEL